MTTPQNGRPAGPEKNQPSTPWNGRTSGGGDDAEPTIGRYGLYPEDDPAAAHHDAPDTSRRGTTTTAAGATAATARVGGGATDILKKVLVVLIPAVLALGIFFLARGLFTDEMKVGDCAVLSSDAGRTEYKKIACGDTSKGVTYHVAEIKKGEETCANANYGQNPKEDSKGRRTMTYCMVPDLRQDVCYDFDNGAIKEASCDLSNALKVVSIKQQGDAQCEGEAVPLNYGKPDPGLTYCLTGGK